MKNNFWSDSLFPSQEIFCAIQNHDKRVIKAKNKKLKRVKKKQL